MSKKVKAKWVVAIPEGTKVMVNVGEEVDADSDLLEVTGEDEKIVNVAGRIRGLSKADKKRMTEMLPGMKINENEVVFESKGFFPKKIILPINGEVIKIDEFENLHFREHGDRIRKVVSPVKAKVVKIDEQRLEIEFKAVEYMGRGIGEGKVWGTKGMDYVNEIAELSAKNKDKVILTENFNLAWLYKAEVVGVKGVVIIDDGKEEKNDRISFKFPILALEKNEWDELKAVAAEAQKAMVNASSGRLLLVI